MNMSRVFASFKGLPIIIGDGMVLLSQRKSYSKRRGMHSSWSMTHNENTRFVHKKAAITKKTKIWLDNNDGSLFIVHSTLGRYNDDEWSFSVIYTDYITYHIRFLYIWP